MNSAKKIHQALEDAIAHVVTNREQYVNNPKTDFTRNRKLPMKDVINYILSMNGGSLKKELYEFSKIKKTTLTASAFVQQRSKISIKAFRDIFHYFNISSKDDKKYHGYRLLAIDGTDVNCARNPESENFMSTATNAKGFNLIHANALYDVLNRTYFDLFLQPRKSGDERKALIHMLRNKQFDDKCLIIGDRGYEGYNLIATLIDTKNVDFLLRARHGHGAIGSVQKLPMEEIDIDVSIDVTTGQTNEDKALKRHRIQTIPQKAKEGKAYSNHSKIREWDFPSPWTLSFRIVRFKLDTGEYETIITSLPRETFPPEKIKNLYHIRWGIETSFRELKYILGLTNLHCIKDDLVHQEIYATLIMYNYCSRISGCVSISKKTKCKYDYKVNFVMAVHICKNFYIAVKKNFSELVHDISQYTEPVRPGRHDVRNLRPTRFVGFTYRVAA